MTNDNDGSFQLSRRKALASMGAIGAAGALGVGGTYAQFNDTEEADVTFTAGGVDGTISLNGSYNSEHIGDGVGVEHVEVTDQGTVAATVNFTDVKPGDYGCFNFGLNVTNNPAWVASCVNIIEDSDGTSYEPEEEVENASSVGGYSAQQSAGTDVYGSQGLGELAENMLILPYYDNDGSCTFFDPDDNPDFDASSIGDFSTPSEFWSNSQDDGGVEAQTEFETQDGETYYLAPRTVRDVQQNVRSIDTAHWNSEAGSLGYYTAPNGSAVHNGCMMLEGSSADGFDTQNNTQGVSPLQPGTTLNFGYDWHIPFSTGNEAQGDELKMNFEFVFLQTRHTEAPQFGAYSPGSNA